MTKLLNYTGDNSIFKTDKKYLIFSTMSALNGLGPDGYSSGYDYLYKYFGYTMLFYHEGYWRYGDINTLILDGISSHIHSDFIIECDGDYV